MTTDAIDLIRLIRQDPDLRDSLRRELLSKELIELPEKVAGLTVRVESIGERLESLTARVESIGERLESLTIRVESLTARVESLSETVAKLSVTVEGLARRIDRLSDDFGVFRGNFAERAAVKNAAGLVADLDNARDLGLNEISLTVLSREQIQQAARSSGDDFLGGFPRSQRVSLYDADLVISVPRRDGEDAYVAVQTSYTCDSRDTTRALDNAALLEATTGKSAFAVVAGARVDRRIEGALSRGDVHWFRLFERDMEPDEPA